MTDSVSINVIALGERALVVELGGELTAEHQARLCALAERYRNYPGIVEAVPGMFNLTIQYHPQQYSLQSLKTALLADWPLTSAASFVAQELDIPVRYGGEDGPDLAWVADYCGMTEQELVRHHSDASYQVFFLGFQPGFAYLGGLPEALVTPRKETPRMCVPAGSVAIGGAQTGIYPDNGPGGWQLIGRTAKTLFDIQQQPPVLLFPGARVRFIPVTLHGDPWTADADDD